KIQGEAGELAEGDASADDVVAAEPEDEGDGEAGREGHHGPEGTHVERPDHHSPHELAVLRREGRGLRLLLGVCLNGTNAGDVLLDVVGELAELVVDLAVSQLHRGPELDDDHDENG